MHFTGHIGNVGCMVTDSLKVIDGMKIKGCLPCLGTVHLMLCELHQIFPKTAFVFIDQVLFSLYLIKFILLIFIQKVHGTVDILAKLPCHTAHGTMTLSNSKCRIIQKTFFQKIKVCFIFQFLCTVFYKPAHQLLDLRYEREKNTYCCYTEYSIQ